ncbi:MAG: hypothetical protein V3V99_07775 [candidate division Zixibacteria bacterium]
MKIKTTLGVLFTLTVFAILLSGIALADKKQTKQDPEQISESTEMLNMNWPEGGQWHSGLKKTYGLSMIEFFYPKDQSQSNWTEMGSTEINPITKEVPIISTARSIFLGTQKASPEATWDILERGTSENGNKYVLFEIICPEFRTKEDPQIQYWKLIDGKLKSYTVQYSFKGTTIPEDKKKEILDAIKKSKLITAKKI